MNFNSNIIGILLLNLFLFPHYLQEKKHGHPEQLNIYNHGIKVFNLNEEDTNIQYNYNKINPSIQQKILKLLPKNYVFLNYSYVIKDSSLYTFHRDVTSSKSFNHLTYPSYTLIIYLYKGNHLTMCEKSHNIYNTVSNPYTIYGNIGQCILFDADLVHASALANTTERYCKQYKIAHKDDIKKLNKLNGTHIVKERSSRKITLIERFVRMMSHKYIFLFDNTYIGSIIERKYDNKIINFISKKLKLNFYNQ
jgi:hypothetical protein